MIKTTSLAILAGLFLFMPTVDAQYRPVRDTVRDYVKYVPRQFSPDDPWTMGHVMRTQVGFGGFFFNCDGEESKRYSPYIDWNCQNANCNTRRLIQDPLRCQWAEIKQRIAWGGCLDCNECSHCGGAEGACHCGGGYAASETQTSPAVANQGRSGSLQHEDYAGLTQREIAQQIDLERRNKALAQARLQLQGDPSEPTTLETILQASVDAPAMPAQAESGVTTQLVQASNAPATQGGHWAAPTATAAATKGTSSSFLDSLVAPLNFSDQSEPSTPLARQSIKARESRLARQSATTSSTTSTDESRNAAAQQAAQEVTPASDQPSRKTIELPSPRYREANTSGKSGDDSGFRMFRR